MKKKNICESIPERRVVVGVLMALSTLLLLLSTAAFGQGSGSIKGDVVDEKGGKVSRAEVLLRSPAGVQLSTSTNDDGTFEFSGIPSGQYLIEVKAQGFSAFASDKIIVERGQSKHLEVTLKVATVNENVVITAAGIPQRADEVAKVISILDSRQIEEKRPELKKATYRIPHLGYASTAANYVLHLAGAKAGKMTPDP